MTLEKLQFSDDKHASGMPGYHKGAQESVKVFCHRIVKIFLGKNPKLYFMKF